MPIELVIFKIILMNIIISLVNNVNFLTIIDYHAELLIFKIILINIIISLVNNVNFLTVIIHKH